jgi:hypothetical protein
VSLTKRRGLNWEHGAWLRWPLGWTLSCLKIILFDDHYTILPFSTTLPWEQTYLRTHTPSYNMDESVLSETACTKDSATLSTSQHLTPSIPEAILQPRDSSTSYPPPHPVHPHRPFLSNSEESTPATHHPWGPRTALWRRQLISPTSRDVGSIWSVFVVVFVELMSRLYPWYVGELRWSSNVCGATPVRDSASYFRGLFNSSSHLVYCVRSDCR